MTVADLVNACGELLPPLTLAPWELEGRDWQDPSGFEGRCLLRDLWEGRARAFPPIRNDSPGSLVAFVDQARRHWQEHL